MRKLTRVLRTGPALAILSTVVLTTAAGSSAAAAQQQVILGAVGNSQAETVAREQETGRFIGGVRVFKRWDQPLINADQRWDVQTGHTLFLSVKTRLRDGTLMSWRDIANAAPDSTLYADMLRHASELKSVGATVYLAFNHEPDAKTSRPMGTAADYVAAWRRYVSVLRSAGATNVRYVWTLTDFAFQQGYAAPYYPGDGYVDAIGVDAYNWYDCTGAAKPRWTSLAALIEPQRQFGLKHPGKALMVMEFGSVEDRAQPGRKAQWIRDAAALFTRPGYESYRALLHWDDRYTAPPGACQFDYRTSPVALGAWQAIAGVTPPS